MLVVTVNVNGIRAAVKKGLIDWLLALNADIICMQEIKISKESDFYDNVSMPNYHIHLVKAKKNGYSGVALLSKIPIDSFTYSVGIDILETEGRFISINIANTTIISLYMPSGGSSPAAQNKKDICLDQMYKLLSTYSHSSREYLICGDLNIAHQNIDIKNWKGNTKNSGFLPHERQWLTSIFDLGFTDIWRSQYDDVPGYTWWSNYGNAYANDVGWRIDYQLCTKGIAQFVNTSSVFKDIKFSDHAPLIVEYSQFP